MKKLAAILILCLVLALSSGGSIGAAHGGRTYPVMHPDQETLEKWIEDYSTAPLAELEVRSWEAASLGGSQDLLGHLEYTPGERDQGVCGNCWVWAGTGIMEIALDVQEGIRDRLSIQYLNSNYNGGSGSGWACCGGDLWGVADFYDDAGITIPWSNTNAQWQDYSRQCGDHSSSVPADTISTTPSYSVSSIQAVTIPTQRVSQATAIANIKNVLDQDKAVWFAFLLPNSSACGDFFTFWGSGNESAVYEMDKFCGIPYSHFEGCGHAVLCVGYNDEDPGNSYWIMLNSWGTTSKRPNGLFRINMDMAYGCVNLPYYSFYWQTLDVSFIPTSIVAPTVTTTAITFVGETIATLNGLVDNDGGEACQYRFEYDVDSGEPYAYNTGWAGSKTTGQSFSQAISGLAKGTKYYFIAQAKNSAGTGSGSELSFLTKPDAPSSFIAGATGTSQINLSWIKGEGAQKTKVQRNEGNYPANKDDGTQVYFGEGTSVSDTGLNPGTTYYYRAWSYVQGSEQWSDNYAQASATTGSAPNNPPNTPSNASPANHATGVSINADLSWTGGDPDAADTVTYDVYFDTSETPPLVSDNQAGTSYDPGALAYNTKYYWKIVATDNHGASTTGPVWDFTTGSVPNSPPNTPSNASPANHATGVSINADLSWTGGDPDAGDIVTYDVYFGTSSSPPLVSNDQSGTTYDPGALAYNTKYYRQIVATDNHAASTVGPVWEFTTGDLCQDEPSPEVGFASLIADGELVIAYNFDPFTTVPTAMNGWTWYDPMLPPAQNNLDTLCMYTAYWVKVTEECWLTYGTRTYHLAAGWNNPVWLGC